MDNKDLRKFICDNITSLSDNKINILYNYIKENNISHTENKNGLFINLSLCDDKYIDYFYEIINISDKNKYNNHNNLIETNLLSNISYLKNNKKIVEGNKIIQKDIKLNPLEILILSYSFINKI